MNGDIEEVLCSPTDGIGLFTICDLCTRQRDEKLSLVEYNYLKLLYVKSMNMKYII